MTDENIHNVKNENAPPVMISRDGVNYFPMEELIKAIKDLTIAIREKK